VGIVIGFKKMAIEYEFLMKIREEDEHFKKGGRFPPTLKKLIEKCPELQINNEPDPKQKKLTEDYKN
jgi:hypothetical protein